MQIHQWNTIRESKPFKITISGVYPWEQIPLEYELGSWWFHNKWQHFFFLRQPDGALNFDENKLRKKIVFSSWWQFKLFIFFIFHDMGISQDKNMFMVLIKKKKGT